MRKTSLLYFGVCIWLFISAASSANDVSNKKSDMSIALNLYELTLDVGQDAYGEHGSSIVPIYYTGISTSFEIRPIQHLGFEIIYIRNSNDYEERVGILGYNAIGKSNWEFDILTLKASVFAFIPATEKQLELFGSIGAGQLKYKLNVVGRYQTPKGETGELLHYKKKGTAYGVPLSVGLEYRPTNSNFSVRLEYTLFTRHTTKRASINERAEMMSIGLKYHFKTNTQPE